MLAMQVEALVTSNLAVIEGEKGKLERLKKLNAGLGIGGIDASKFRAKVTAITPRIPMMVE